jgi:hypothetical protein
MNTFPGEEVSGRTLFGGAGGGGISRKTPSWECQEEYLFGGGGVRKNTFRVEGIRKNTFMGGVRKTTFPVEGGR